MTVLTEVPRGRRDLIKLDVSMCFINLYTVTTQTHHWSSGWSQLAGSAQMKEVVLVIGIALTDKDNHCGEQYDTSWFWKF